MGLPARLALLVATVSVMSLPLPHFRTAFRTAVALATVATDTDCEYGATSRVTANPKPKNSVLVDVHIGHKEIIWTVCSFFREPLCTSARLIRPEAVHEKGTIHESGAQ